ncbi:MAG: hypothetical protein JWP22_787 [Ramlibacter sp.]|nr:hypothetical protein [Ramlibacter sp.]
MRTSLTRRELALLAFVAVLALVALVAPPLAQPPLAHGFADQRTLWSVPHALDVLSNLPFALAGACGLWTLGRAGPLLSSAERGCALLFFTGLLVTAAGSAWYHLVPGDIGLAIDRGSMSFAFAGLLGLLAGTLVGDRAGRAVAASLLVMALGSVAVWFATGNVLPWALVQFGGIPLLLLAVFRPAPAHALQVRWAWVLLAYAVAKWFELNDQVIFEASGELLSGHTLKHIAAALAAWPLIAAVAARLPSQNGRQNKTPAAVRRFGRA